MRMKRSQSLLEVLFPRVRAEMLRLLFFDPSKRRYLSELRNMSGLTLCTVQDEIRKLAAIGLIHSWRDRKRRFCCANHQHPLFSELVRLVHGSGRLPRTERSVLQRRSAKRTRKKRNPEGSSLFRPVA